MENSSRWKKICSMVLAVCLLGTLLVSNQSFGVLAEEESQTSTEQELEANDLSPQSSLEMEKQGESDTTENDELDNNSAETGSIEEKNILEESPEVISDSENKGKVEETENGVNTLTVEQAEPVVGIQNEENQIVFDLAKGSVCFSDNSYSGWAADGSKINGTYSESKEYVIQQSNRESATNHTISVGTLSEPVTKNFNIYLAGINIDAPAGETDHSAAIYVNTASNVVNLILKDSTENKVVAYASSTYGYTHSAIEKEINTQGTLRITCESGLANKHDCTKDSSCGTLIATAKSLTNDTYHSGAGIGSKGYLGDNENHAGTESTSGTMYNLQIAGGKIWATGAGGTGNGGGPGIGIAQTGPNSQSVGYNAKGLIIDGGYIIARAGNGASANVGGGFHSGYIDLTINGGYIEALRNKETWNIEKDTYFIKDVGAAIGGGSGGSSTSAFYGATVKITGGTIVANAAYGAAIGSSAGGTSGSGAPVKIDISGGTITAKTVTTEYSDEENKSTSLAKGYGAAIGTGGSAGTGRAGDADICITGGTINAQSEYGADIGGGGTESEQDVAVGGKGEIEISGSACITTTGSGIGGGPAVAGVGGDAKVTISGGNVTTTAIGGGTSKSNQGGDASVSVTDGTLNVTRKIGGGNSEEGDGGDASIYVSGGTLDCASIGGGNSATGTPGSVTSSTQAAGVVVTGGTLKAGTIGGGTNETGGIGFATAEISGGTIQGQFILANTDTNKKCFFHMTGGTINNKLLGDGKYLKAQENGGAVYLSDPNGEATISGGTIKNSNAVLGGAVYMTAGTVTLSGDAVIQECQAMGNSEKNIKAQGGAFYLKSGTVNISGGKLLTNKATDGAGIYMNGGSLNVFKGTLAQNEATETGGGAYVQSGTIAMTGGAIGEENAPNKAVRGAGVYIAGGTLNVNGGSIQKNEATEAGGGAYLASGDLNISDGSIAENTAPDGAGAYLAGGNLTINDKGAFSKNTATQNGGAAYLAKGTLILNGGSVSSNIAEKNGGGFYAADGAVQMFGGNITGNTAKEAGGGLFVSSDTSAADVVIRSGDITGNIAGTSGGGIAVASTSGNARNDKVIVGLLAEHKDLAVDENDPAKRVFTEFLYTDDKDKQEHTHKSCPVLKDNKASDDGGGIYMESSNAELDIYCLIESGNSSVSNTAGNGAMMAGGTVTIGDATHNTENAYGNIVISSSILVEGGNVNIWGNMKNPLFKNNILVDIKGLAEESNGSFTDNRSQTTSEINYKIHYFENFTEEGATNPTGRYTAKQYEEGADISPEGALFSHEGWKIVGWANEEDKNNNKITYNIGGNLIGSKGDHSAWGNDNTKPLILYAIWQRITYTVKFDANAGTEKFSGMMNNQGFTYGVAQQLFANQYKIKGKQFSGWSTSKDENGIKYAADYNESKMTTADNNPTIILYAQWVNCTHEKKQYTQSSSAANTIEINCDCGYQTTITLSGVTAYYNGNPHPASLDITGDALLDETPVIQYQKKQDNESFGNMPEGENVPTNVGKYQASITVGEITVSVEYEIQSATEGIDISAKIAAGQYFKEFTNEENISLSQDDAFTVQFNVFHLKSEIYKTEPELAFSENLPVGTTIIMQNGNQYAYLKMDSSEKTIKLTEFTVMGNSSKFQYVADKIQTYRFIVDFSQTNNTIGNMNVSLTYDPSGDVVQKLEKTVALNCTKKSAFQLNFIKDANTLSITAPDNTGNNRWNKMEQILIFQGEDTIPSDAKLTVTNGETTEISLNAAKQFVVPITWATSQNIQLSLTTEQLAKVGNYSFEVSLYAGASDGQTLIKAKSMNIAVNTNITLVAQTDIQPSLKLSGTQRIVGVQDTALSLNVEMKNIESSSLSVKIQKKTGDSYGGDYLTGASVKAGENIFSLTGITEPGSYCLSVTGATAEQKKVIVPYYFVVQ